MKKFTVKELLWACGGSFSGNPCILDQEITNYAYMLNRLKKGGAYFIYQDTNEIASISMRAAHSKGAIICITDKEVFDIKGNYIKVDNMMEATRAFGRYARNFVNIPVIAVTGSVGKTSTKDMIVSVLSQKYRVTKTSPYWNANYRIVFCILNIDEKDEVIVVEAAVGNMQDNIENGKIVRPDIVVMTNVGESHIDSFKTRDNIFIAKKKLLKYLSPVGKVYANGCDEYMKTVTVPLPQRYAYFGRSEKMEYYAKNIVSYALNGTNCDLIYKDNCVNVTIPVPGIHYTDCALAGFAIGLDFGLDLGQIKMGIEKFETSDHRSKVIEKNGITIFEDCYSTVPKSIKAAVDTFNECIGRKVFIFGDINRLGEKTEYYHREVGKYLAGKNIDILICVGSDSKFLIEELKKQNSQCEVFHLEKKTEVKDLLPKVLRPGDNVLIKGAYPEHFEDVTQMILDYLNCEKHKTSCKEWS